MKELTLNRCNITLKVIKILSPCLAKNDSIETLDFSANKMTDIMGKVLVRLLQLKTEKRDNIIWYYGLRGDYPDFIDNVGLKSIILKRNFLGVEFIKSLCRWLRYDDYVRHIDLRYNQIPATDGIKDLAINLEENKSIVSMELIGNHGYRDRLHKRIALTLLRNLNKIKREKKMIRQHWIKPNIFKVCIPKKVLK